MTALSNCPRTVDMNGPVLDPIDPTRAYCGRRPYDPMQPDPRLTSVDGPEYEPVGEVCTGLPVCQVCLARAYELAQISDAIGDCECAECVPWLRRQPHLLYLLAFPELGLVKVGITHVMSTRLARWRRIGWELWETPVLFEDWASAHDEEQRRKRWMRSVGTPVTAMPGDTEGHTETFAIDEEVMEEGPW